MSDENLSPEQPSPEQPSPEQPAPEAAQAAEAPTVQAPVEGEIPPGAVPPGAVPPGAVPPGAVPPGHYYYPPGFPAGQPRRGFTRFVRHRATQLVAAAVLGLLVGGGTIALVDNASAGPGYGHHHYVGNYGPGYGFQGGGQGFGQQPPNGN